ncbi:hypothetical protein [Nocardia pseudobrasiliensis]|uniref:Methyltransferase family protein n=1 Tax=Nocardia pseudobrasiliensis TaxID=45979 RepID=A0A370HXV2_9NOCA|nr:hypothetical protein [Nocardia pseudobrasiliensis]RDI62741.1 hypothetical protein DFR76_11258 [Nocardia pseudobrasiliensis]
MTGLVLTARRRGELAELLGDEQRLRARYPRVAEYLDAAARLPGTGDEQVDAAFDLRLTHYLTGGASPSGNPYWDIVEPAVRTREGRRMIDGGRDSGSARLGYAETILQAHYAYAVPSPQTLRWIARFADGRTVVELGAGRGYWARLLAGAGVSVAAFDSHPPDRGTNASFPGREIWYPVGDLDAYAATPKADRVLLLCWPPGWGDLMASRALEEFEKGGGDRLVFIGEPRGGKTGIQAFFDRLDAMWRLESEDPQHVSWWNLSDGAQAWSRR